MKTDKVDLAAIGDMLLAGKGTTAPAFADPIMTLTGWVNHRRRRSLVRRRTIQQLTTHVDRCFPGLGRAMWSVALSKAGRLIITDMPDPARVARLGPSRLRRYAANRGVRMTTPLAEKIVDAARLALPVPVLTSPDACWLQIFNSSTTSRTRSQRPTLTSKLSSRPHHSGCSRPHRDGDRSGSATTALRLVILNAGPATVSSTGPPGSPLVSMNPLVTVEMDASAEKDPSRYASP